MKRTKVLLVIPGLEQAGCQRWIFEICSNIDKDKFDISVLCHKRYLGSGEESKFDNYYYLKLKDLNISLYEYIGADGLNTLWQRGTNKIKAAINKALQKKHIRTNHLITELFRTNDIILLADSFTFNRVEHELSRSGNDNFLVLLFTHRMQFVHDPYSAFRKLKNGKFVYFCPNQIAELGENGVHLVEENLFNFPLVLNLTNYPYLFNPVSNGNIVISIFTRIVKSKPIDIFIEAFAKLQKLSQHKCVLNIYGEISDENYQKELLDSSRSLGLDPETVHFKGHTMDIAKTIQEDRINIYWGMGMNMSVGYSSIEIGAMGIPSIFWNYDHKSSSTFVQEQTNGQMFGFNQVDDFVKANLDFFENTDFLKEVSIKQREYFFRTNNIVDKIKDFEKYIEVLTANSQASSAGLNDRQTLTAV